MKNNGFNYLKKKDGNQSRINDFLAIINHEQNPFFLITYFKKNILNIAIGSAIQ